MALNLSLFLLRWVLGFIFLAHGSQKLFGWWSGPGLKGFSNMVGWLGLRPARFWATLAALAEFIGGLLLVVGLLTPLGALAILAVMLMALAAVHVPKGFWNSKGGIEFPLVLACIALAIGIAGPGAWSLDYALALPVRHPIWFLIASACVALGTALLLVTSSRVQVSMPKPEQKPASPTEHASAKPSQAA